MWLYQNATDAELRDAADRLRQRLHPASVVTYPVDRNINYTNVCIIDCGFCAFYRKPASPEGYLLTNEQIGEGQGTAGVGRDAHPAAGRRCILI
jgi:cyclic dehypoxanthinyl futalosine synthase